jgi:hypothetical protein
VPDNPSHANAANGENDSNAAKSVGAVATAVRELLGGVRAGQSLRAGGLTLIPLLPATEQVKRQTGYLPLEEALRHNLVTIAEQAQASVPELVATSTAEMPVVLVGGEQVVGGLQNRVLNTTILVPARQTQNIPVTCVEAGRWHEARPDFASAMPNSGAPIAMDEAEAAAEAPAEIGQTAANVAQSPTPRKKMAARAFASEDVGYALLRRAHSKYVTDSLSSGGGYHSDQSAVWNEVSSRITSTGSYSPSSAMDTLYKTPERANKLNETMEALKRPDGALGFVALVGGHVLGAELFADEALADAYWTKLARSYAVEALDAAPADESGAASETDDAANIGEAKLLEDALAAEIQVHPSPGLGTDARLVSSAVSGAGLVYDGAVVHLSLFPEDAATDGEQPAQTQRHYGGHRQTNI